ncbi:MAG: CRISPR-associated protein Csx3 [Nitrososphaeria archaeon]|nr:CRISPR-associated protein Csx3 [Nitrososphaeria archaeon]
MNFSLLEGEGFTLVHFQLENSIIPNVLKEVVPPKVDPTRGVVLGGRAPVWLYCYLVHYYHPTKFVAVYDPRLGGAVVVESHTPEFVVGDIIEVRV